MPEQARASPDALLALANKEHRGHLKIFLGAAPGVGKTYAMLTAARTEAAAGRDVAVGLVETHGRRETAALLDGLEVLQRRPIVHQNRILHDFDLDAALARHPSLLIVDELAHTNVAGSRHPKRWQDIDELLDAGIDVWTTLNIQHLESLNDVIQKITKVRVRETVPDSVFEDAGEIVLVDFPPDELLKRLAEGKVYVEDTAARAVEGFFKPQNLTALRELALRRAAERIDADLVGHMRAQGVEGPWAAGERILACVGPDSTSAMIVRTAKRLADLMDARWSVVVVEKPTWQGTAAERRQIAEALSLAESLGAQTRTLIGQDLVAEILRYARAENATQIVIGRAQRRALAFWQRNLAEALTEDAEGIAVHIVTAPREAAPAPKRPWRLGPLFEPTALLWSALVIALAVGIGRAVTAFMPFPNISLVFIVAVLFSAIRFGMWPAIFASVLAFASYNFFFIEPLYSFTVAQPYELFALLVFLVVAVITSATAGKVREQAQSAVSRMRATRRLYEFTRGLSGLVTADEIAEGAASEIYESLMRPALILLEKDGNLDLRGAWPPEDALDAASLTAARWASSHDEAAGAETGTLPTVPWLFLPLRTPRARVGVLGIAHGPGQPPLDAEARSLLDTLAEQTASALERATLAKEMADARAAAETERVRNTLLASISHDFRTPLAAILGSATSLIAFSEKLKEADRQNLLGQIKEEAEGLDEMVRNLLAIARIDAGGLELNRDWVDLREIVGRVVAAAVRRGAEQKLAIALLPDLPPVFADAALVEQAVGNILGNTIAHTPPQTRLVVDAAITGEGVALRFTDDGPGIPPEMLPRVFDKFVRARQSDRGGADKGTGLGLAIAKGIMEAHQGAVYAESPVAAGRGTRLVLTFPAKARA